MYVSVHEGTLRGGEAGPDQPAAASSDTEWRVPPDVTAQTVLSVDRFTALAWPRQYVSGKSQLEALVQRERAALSGKA